MMGTIRQMCVRVLATRHFNTTTHTQKYKVPTANAGINRQLKMIKEDEADIDKADIDYESIEELEVDFMQADEIHDDIINQMKKISKAQEYKITERKHFRPPKEPSMLTWSEKQQIKHLHQSDPEKWTCETLAESFPASPEIIKKILKNKYRTLSAEKLKAYDLKVSENWIAFHRGQLTVHDPRLRAHLEKFTDRRNGVRIISDEDAAKITEIHVPKPKHTEFLSLVTSFKANNDTNKTEDTTKIEQTKVTERSHVLPVIERSQAHYSLDQFRKRLDQELENFSEIPQDIQAIMGSKNSNVLQTEVASSEQYVAPSERFKADALVYRKHKQANLKLIDQDAFPNQIKIPKNKWKPGFLYKVNDCFYNDKGYFLYRVPGMKS